MIRLNFSVWKFPRMEEKLFVDAADKKKRKASRVEIIKPKPDNQNILNSKSDVTPGTHRHRIASEH